MAKDTRPEYYYHPVVGAYSPAALGLYLSRSFRIPRLFVSFPISRENEDAYDVIKNRYMLSDR